MDEGTWHKVVGITMAILGSFFTGLSFILQKKAHQSLHLEDPNDTSYLKSYIWWMGMLSMGVGEILNFGAYAFQPAIVVTPLGALSVAVSAILSAVILQERLSFSGVVGCTQCILGSVIIVLNAPHSTATNTVDGFFYYVISPGFLVYTFFCGLAMVYLNFFVAPKYGKKNPAVYITIVAIVGSYLVVSAQGFGSAMVYSFSNWETDNQFLKWPFYPLLAVVILTALYQVSNLNKALSLFSPSVVAPINYVFFTTMTIITSAILFQGFHVESVSTGITMFIGFLTIVGGVALLFQYSLKLNKLRLKLSTVVEDIDDAAEEEELDENPLKLMDENTKPENARITRTVLQSAVVSPEPQEVHRIRRIELEPVARFEKPNGGQTPSIRSDTSTNASSVIHQYVASSNFSSGLPPISEKPQIPGIEVYQALQIENSNTYRISLDGPSSSNLLSENTQNSSIINISLDINNALERAIVEPSESHFGDVENISRISSSATSVKELPIDTAVRTVDSYIAEVNNRKDWMW